MLSYTLRRYQKCHIAAVSSPRQQSILYQSLPNRANVSHGLPIPVRERLNGHLCWLWPQLHPFPTIRAIILFLPRNPSLPYGKGPILSPLHAFSSQLNFFDLERNACFNEQERSNLKKAFFSFPLKLQTYYNLTKTQRP